MRILHIASEHPPQEVYGLGRYVCDLSRELASQGHAVHVLTNSISGRDQDVMDHGVALHRVDFPPPPKPPGEHAPALAFNLHLQQRAQALGRGGLGDPEVVVSHDWLTALAGQRIADTLGVPHVWTVHDLIVGKSMGAVDGLDQVLVQHIERWACRTADRVLVNSRAVGIELREHYGARPERVRLLHCAIDPGRFSNPAPATRLAAFRRAFAAPEELLLTYVGRLDLEKGIDTLINAFAIVHAERPQIALAIVGTGLLEETIRAHIAHHRLEAAVRLHGYLRGEALKSFYRAGDIHICPSHYEPFGLVVAEAMASGRAVVASATGGLMDLIDGPEVGCLVPPRDHGALAQAILSLARDPDRRATMGAAAAQRIGDHFSWQTMARTAAGHYQELLPVGVA